MRLPHNAAMRRRLAILVFGALVAASSPAFADNTEAAKAFEEGRKLRDQREFEKAASAFERSIAAEPSIGAYYNLGFSNEQLGRFREALDGYREAARIARSKGDARVKETSEAITKLLEAHNYITVSVPDDLDKTAGVRVTIDGETVAPKQLSGEVFRSGTQHEVVVAAPGRRDRRFKVANRQPVTLTLGDAYETTTPPPPPPPPHPPPASSDGWGWQKWTGVGLGVAGLGATIAGVVFTSDFFSTRSDILADFKTSCPEDPVAKTNPCNRGAPRAHLLTLRDHADANASRAALRQSIAYGAAGLLFIGGIYLFVTAPSASTESASPSNTLRVRVVPQVGQRDSSLWIVGDF